MELPVFDKEAHKALMAATSAIQDYIKPYKNDKDYLEKLKFMVFAVISSTIEINEASGMGDSSYLWTEVEALAKNRGLEHVAKKIKSGREYNLAEIDPDDTTSGMNYLGQELATTLFKHIHDLPMKQRKPEMFLRAVEALLGNLLRQRFAEFDQHKILDDLCEHVHMVLNEKPQLKIVPKPDEEKAVKPKSKIHETVVKIDKKVNKILASGGEKALIGALPELIGDLNIIIKSKDKEVDTLIKEYRGFFILMKLIEGFAHGLSTGEIKVP